MNSFLKKVAATIEKFHMTNKSERLIVCLSGGADSVTLLLCLKELGYDVCACHVNHHLRGEESDRDEKFCVDFCKALDIDIKVFHADVIGYCKEHSVSTEEGARILRYGFFETVGVDKICTAHSLSDCLETTIFNLARGTGLKGLCGIPPVRGNIIRPLIECTREEIEGYLAQKGQDFVTDSTNLTDDYSRNKIRHLVVPRLRELNDTLFASYEQTADRLRTDSDYLETTAQKAFEKAVVEGGYNAEYLKTLHESIRRRGVMKVLQAEKLDISRDRIEQIDRIILQGGKYNISSDMFVLCAKGILSFVKLNDLSQRNVDDVPINAEGVYTFNGRKVIFKISDYDGKNGNVHKMFANCCLDYDKIKGEIVLSNRKEGDKIRLVNRDFESDLRKLINKAFRLEQRRSVIILRDNEGVVFVESYGAADRVKITPDTKHILSFEIK